jgi:hypothetical protein
MSAILSEHVTPVKWPRTQDRYGALESYLLAVDWLKDCTDVADWGGAQGFFGTLLPARVRYTVVDGTRQRDDQVLADLMTYHVHSDGILLRHVLDHTRDWRGLLQNAMQCSRRLVVITFTPPPAEHQRTVLIEKKSGWPVRRFDVNDLRKAMGDWLVSDEDVPTTHPERIYYLERPCVAA